MGSSARPDAGRVTTGVLQLATAADLEEIVALERECYGDPWPASAFAPLPDNPRVFFALVRDDVRGRVSGYVVAWYVLDEAELANLAVAPWARRRGVGRILLDAMLRDAEVRGVARVFLEVRESNRAARELYGARGFGEVGRRRGYYRTPVEDALILRRTLGP